MAILFEWDEKKAKANLQKHKVDFSDAKSVFGDPFSITIDDPDHSGQEQRFIDVGKSMRGNLLVVVYTERENRIRIINCRRATPAERKKYEEQFEKTQKS
ncbi:MAG TPA: BrnT family toxin [Anaerolineales bacterium]|nr:BrnT family toxin [Anaerolineales bacterium]